MFGHHAFERGVLGLKPFEPLARRAGQPLVSAAPVVEGRLGDAVLAAKAEVVAALATVRVPQKHGRPRTCPQYIFIIDVV